MPHSVLAKPRHSGGSAENPARGSRAPADRQRENLTVLDVSLGFREPIVKVARTAEGESERAAIVSAHEIAEAKCAVLRVKSVVKGKAGVAKRLNRVTMALREVP